jgi:hypothetical protein
MQTGDTSIATECAPEVPKERIVSAALPVELIAEIDAYAARLKAKHPAGVFSRSGVIRQALAAFLKSETP